MTDIDDDFEDDDFCVECGDAFHYDDIGGYNPPCACGMHCRSCHEAIEGRRDPDNDDERDDDDYPEGDCDRAASPSLPSPQREP